MTSRAEKRRQRARKRNEDRAAARAHIPGDTQPDEIPAVREVVDHSQGAPRSRVERIPRHERPRAQVSTLDSLGLDGEQRRAASTFYEHWRNAGLDPWVSAGMESVSMNGPRAPAEGPRFPEYCAAMKVMGEMAGNAVRNVVCCGWTIQDLAKTNGVSHKGAKAFFMAGIRALTAHYGFAPREKVEAA